MAFLLKIKPAAFEDMTAIVPKQKSSALSSSNIGADVFVWLDDSMRAKSALLSICRILRVSTIDIPQVRNPQKTKQAYQICLELISNALVNPLSTDDLEQFRYSRDRDGIGSLGSIHRDRNDKIIVLTEGQTQALQDRFRRG